MSTTTGSRRARPRRWRRVPVLSLATALLLVAVSRVLLGVGISTVLSGSMAPAYERGDLVLTRPVAVSRLRVGDVPVLPAPGQDRPYVHRVVQLHDVPGGRVVRTQGDANPAPDAWSDRVADGTVPVVVAVVPGLGRLPVVALDPRSRALLVALTGLLVTVLAVREVLRTPPASPAGRRGCPRGTP